MKKHASHRGAIAALIAGAALLAACGVILGLEDPAHHQPAASDAADAAAPDARVPLAIGCGAACVAEADPGAGIFVDGVNGADTTSCGPATAPCKSIRAGIQAARARAVREVYVAAGLYRETVSLFAGIDVIGGFTARASGWTRSCASAAPRTTIVEAPASETRTVVADNLGGDAKLEALIIRSKSASAVAPGESIYGVFARATATTLCLRDVDVEIGNAGDGRDGDAGAAGQLLPCGTDGGTGANGTSGDAGAPAKAGAFAAEGFVTSAGAPGSDGTPGRSSPYVPGSCPPGQGGFCDAVFKQDGVVGGCVPANVAQVACPVGARPGCGGGPGRGGASGGGGGSAIALYVVDATIDVIGGSLSAGNGGAGGAGGEGADGGAGSSGVKGSCPVSNPDYPTCSTGQEDPVGSVVANGGYGGRGGAGGAGAAGHSCAIYKSAFASVQVSTTTQKKLGSPRPGRNGAPAGVAQEICP